MYTNWTFFLTRLQTRCKSQRRVWLFIIGRHAIASYTQRPTKRFSCCNCRFYAVIFHELGGPLFGKHPKLFWQGESQWVNKAMGDHERMGSFVQQYLVESWRHNFIRYVYRPVNRIGSCKTVFAGSINETRIRAVYSDDAPCLTICDNRQQAKPQS